MKRREEEKKRVREEEEEEERKMKKRSSRKVKVWNTIMEILLEHLLCDVWNLYVKKCLSKLG